ncbi:ribosome silencing factor [Virgibacillus halophilus]|uniref:Ribosomal silencing factor RsfS n=1 Tax=Tigheibacillus halophilus TaxID=361280 RepID=A0ABU5CDU7_9BACI|nr:ribosome silencing factor [Virgibacillus halophilus]
MNVKEMLSLAAQACDDKRAEEIIALDMEHISLIADYFLICHGSNERQVQAIARAVKEKMEENDISIKRMEGFEQARWILVDIGDIVCHIFHRDERSYYNLERLWGDAPRLALEMK